MINNSPVMRKMQVGSLGQEDPLEDGMAAHSSILAWEIPWTEDPGKLWLMVAFPRHFLLYPTKNLPFTTKEWESFFENVI